MLDKPILATLLMVEGQEDVSITIMAQPIPLTPPPEEPRVLKEADFLAHAQVWPLNRQLDPREWLRNFHDNELPYAYDLLRSFMYFSPDLSGELFRSAVQRLGQYILEFDYPPHVIQSSWRSFVEGLIVVAVRGEEPNTTDSGFTYVRNARNLFGLKESQFYDEADALRQLQRFHRTGIRRDILFVDDFVGSGNQFTETWMREVEVERGVTLSFHRVAAATASRFFYCPLICTEIGASAIHARCHQVVLCPAHLLPPEYSAFHPKSRLWAPERRQSAARVLRAIANRAGMPDTEGKSVDDWQGFHKLGLALAIRDSIPDANLGVFRWDQNGWAPLFKKMA